ncbi:restriction endonuclease subunit S [Acinetobacter baumannii]|nr:restriction endonuclease subunit S [Acinetobacter baumannii]
MVPNGWNKLSLDQLAEVRSGVAKGKTGLKDPITVPYLRVANVQDGRVDLSEVKKIEIERDKLERYSLKYGDVLMNEGGDFDKLGRGDVWLSQIEPCLHQNHVFAVRPQQDRLNSFYLAALAASYYGKKYFLSCAKRSTNLASINSSQIKEFPVLVPPILEQKKIIQILSTWDQAISATEKLLENSQQQKKALAQILLTGKKRLCDESGVRFDGEWKLVKVSDLLKVRKEKQVPTAEVPLFSLTIEDGITPKAERYNREFLVKNTDEKKYKVVKPKDIVYNPANLRWGAINFSRINHAVVVSPIYEVLYVSEKEQVSLEFIAQKLMTKDQINRFAAMIEGTLVERMAVKIEPFLATKLSIPSSLKEQKKIAEILEVADQEIDTLKKKLHSLKQEKQALMQQLLTGKKRVKVAA